LILNRVRLRSNLGQVVHTYVPLSPSSIAWYWSTDGDVLSWEGDRRPGGKIWQPTAGGDLKITCALTACTLGSASDPTLGNEYGKTLHFFVSEITGQCYG